MSARKDLETLVRDLQRQGWTVVKTKNGHWQFISPEAGRAIVVASSTPSDLREIANTRSRLRRAGYRG